MTTTTKQKNSGYFKFNNYHINNQLPQKVLISKNKDKNGKILHPSTKANKKLIVKVLDSKNQPVKDAYVTLGKGSPLSTINIGHGKTNIQGKITFDVTQYPMKNIISVGKKYYCYKREMISIDSKTKQLITIETRTIKPQDIVDLMKRKGWDRGAKNLQEWVNRKASIRNKNDSSRKWAYTDPSKVVLINFEDIINNFSRVQQIYDDILHGYPKVSVAGYPPYHNYSPPVIEHSTPIWKNAESKNNLKMMALRMEEQFGLITSALSSPATNVRFGDLNAPIQEIHSPKNVSKPAKDPSTRPDDIIKSKSATYYNYKEVSSKLRDVFVKDDLTAALANFTINIAAEGFLISDQQRNVVLKITHIGLYIQDNFDFIDDKEDWIVQLFGSQPLGYWNPNTAELSNTGLFNGCSVGVDNEFFNIWRKQSNKGGDYVIYSNIHKVPVSMTINIGKF